MAIRESVYEEDDRGQPPYHPRMMTKILLYGYCVGSIFVAQDPEAFGGRRCFSRVGGRESTKISGPFSDFRKLHLKALEELFQQMLQRLTLETGTMKLGRVALDGSKVQGQREQA